MSKKNYCPYCDGFLRKINGSDMTYYQCDACETLIEPENVELPKKGKSNETT